MKIPLRVHICVVGFELDRISGAAIKEKADKVYLISQKENDKGRIFFIENKKRLINEGIIVEEQFVERINELSGIVSKIKSIIKNEDEENAIYLNISSGSTLSAIAGTMISMMFENKRNIIPYYVKPEFYYENIDKKTQDEIKEKNNRLVPRSIGVKEINEILTFPIRLPNEELLIILKHLQIRENEDEIVTKKDLIEFSKQNKYLNNSREKKRSISVRLKDKSENKNSKSSSKNEKSKQQARDYAWIDQNIINKLKDEWNLIDVKKIGRYSCIKLNEKGKKMLKYLND